MSYIDGWDRGQRQTALICAAVHNAANRICAAFGVDPQKMKVLDADMILDAMDGIKKPEPVIKYGN